MHWFGTGYSPKPKIVYLIKLVTESEDYDDDFVKDWLEIIKKWKSSLRRIRKKNRQEEIQRKFQQEEV